MRILILSLFSIAILYSCGGKTEEEAVETKDSSLTETVVDSIPVADTIPEEPCKRHVENMWTDSDAEIDIPKGYIFSIYQMVNCGPLPDGLDEMDYTYDHINADDIVHLNTHELIYYCLAYPASFSQSCAWDDFIDSTKTPKILGFMGDNYDAYTMSKLQQETLEENRDSVILVLNKFIAAHPKKTDEKYLILLKNLNAVESIPTIVKVASNKNLLAYTLLIRLMEVRENPAFQASEIYPTLFGDESNAFGRRIEATDANRKLIVDLAMKMYKESKL